MPLPLLPGATPVRHQTNPLVQTILTFASGGPSTTPVQHNGDPPGFANPAAIAEFTPQNYGLSSTAVGLLRDRWRLSLTNVSQATTPTGQDATLNYDPFTMSGVGQAMPAATYNPYADDHVAAAAAMGAANPAFFQQNAFATHTQPVCIATSTSGRAFGSH